MTTRAGVLEGLVAVGMPRAGTGCGGCHDDIKGIIEKHFQGAVA